jgi:mono/diheme cytochrome c family protein
MIIRQFAILSRRTRSCVARFLFVSVVGACAAQTPTTSEQAPTAQQQIDQGRSKYTLMCARCHGLNLVSNGLGTDLRQWQPSAKERFYTSVNKGIKAMPAWESLLKPGELDAIWRYVGSVNGWPAE